MDGKILVLIPCYNEEENIVNTVERLKSTCPDVDFLVINDCSTDGSAALLKSRNYPFWICRSTWGSAAVFSAVICTPPATAMM